MVWRDKNHIHILTNTHDASANSNFCDENGNAIKPTIIKDSGLLNF
jgi:hypothetical protein